MNKIFNNFFLFIFFLLFCFQFSQADSSKIYKKKYQNPIGVLNSFLWSDEKGGYIGLTSKVNILSRNLNNTIHPVSIDSFKIKIAFSKLQFKNQDDDNIISIFNAENLEIISLEEKNNEQNEELISDPNSQIEEEIKKLTLAEDKDLEKKFEINEDLQSSVDTSSSASDEQESVS